jgi:hypothetical protein
MAKKQSYQFYLFTKLFDAIHTIEAEYDLLFDELESAYNEYLSSEYNNPNKGEYECMVEYLTNYLPKL